MIFNKTNYYKMFVFGDRHCKSNDPRLDLLLFEILKDNSNTIKYIIDLGDGIDADCISSFDKNHSQLTGLQAELDDDYDFRKKIGDIIPDAYKILMVCNHFSARWNKIKSKEYWMTDLISLEQENLFRLNELKWELREDWIWGKNKLMFMHGDGGLGIGSQKNVINMARNISRENMISVCRGHSHTTGYEISKRFGEYHHSIQVGTMYDLRKAPNYIKSGQYLSNWSNSFGMFYCNTNGKDFFYSPIVIENAITHFEGKLYDFSKSK